MKEVWRGYSVGLHSDSIWCDSEKEVFEKSYAFLKNVCKCDETQELKFDKPTLNGNCTTMLIGHIKGLGWEENIFIQHYIFERRED